MTQEEMVYQLTESLETLLEEQRLEELRLLCAAQRPADLTEALDLLDTETKQAIFRQLDLELAAEVLGECDEDHQRELMAALDEARLARVLEHLPLDEAADAVSELSEDQAFRVLSRINPSESQEIQDLMQYSEDTAGGIMTPDVIAFPETMTVGELLDAFRGSWKRAEASEFRIQPIKPEWENAYELIREENVYTIYVVDRDRRLKGYVRLQDLLRADPKSQLSELLNTDVISVRTGEDQEDVAEMAHKYDMVSIPVIDEENRLVGRITIDDVMDVMEEETTEDMMRMAGTTEDELVTWSALRSMVLRLPWILITLIGLLVTPFVLSFFQATLHKLVQLAFFIPVVCGISGNTGVQSATIVVRGLATGQIDLKEYLAVAWKEFRAGLLIGVVCGLVVMLLSQFAFHNFRMAVVVGLSVMAAISWASLLGVFIPSLLARMGKDPAIATGPIVTSLNDAAAALIYLTIATALI